MSSITDLPRIQYIPFTIPAVVMMMAFTLSSDLHNKAYQHNLALNQVYSLDALNSLNSLCNPAFTEAAFVTCHSDAFNLSLRRLSNADQVDCSKRHSLHECHDTWLSRTMETDAGSASLQRSASHHSNTSRTSSRSATVRVRPRKYASYLSSSASSISDKSLTSFPSLSPESPTDERPSIPRSVDGTANSPRKSSAPSIVDSLTTNSHSRTERNALFDDAPVGRHSIPGSIHHANDEHIERLIARTGAVALVRQISADLAQRDAQIATLRRKGESRERALRKIILECGLSTLDLETRLRVIESERKPSSGSSIFGVDSVTREAPLEDLMTDAMTETVVFGELAKMDNDATIRAADQLRALESKPAAGTAQRGWKDYLWGGTSRKTSRASSINGDAVDAVECTRPPSIAASRKSVLQNGLFQPPGEIRSPSRASSMQAEASSRIRKPSSGLATLALKLVAGSNMMNRDVEGEFRGRANSTGSPQAGRADSTASARTTMSARAAPVKTIPKVVPGRRPTVPSNINTATVTNGRWDTMGASPESTTAGPRTDNYGPVEMDAILPLEEQPPTLTHIYNNHYNSEFLTDRFGFIYDQRRKKRQREAAEKVRKTKRGSRVEMLSSARSGISVEDEVSIEDERPDTPVSVDEDGKAPKRWQDYLKIATNQTELLSHTPSGSEPVFEVMECVEGPRSPGIQTEERGFLPSASTTAQPAVAMTSDEATISKPVISGPPSAELPQEDTEPVKLLLKQLGEVHDSLQRDKTVRWNDFLRKVRAERKRDGEAAAAAIAASTDKGAQRPITAMPEASLADGEMIGVAGLGNKGKVGRAKWNEFKSLVLGGIPVAFRAKIWAECSGATASKIPGYYDDLIANREGEDDPVIVAQIKMDINRTLTDNIFFRKGPGVVKLNEVLLAYSRRNREVGYCQGMNLITACLLLIMPAAEDAFWVLASIIENILPRGYYDHSLLASRADQIVLRQYVSEVLPKLSAHLDDLGIELEALTFQWFLSVFTDCLSAEALFRVWDVVLCTNDGSTFLFQVALALLKLNEQQLLLCSTPAGIYTYINHQMTNHAISIDGLIHASEGLRKVVKRDDVESRRGKAIEAEKDLVRKREERNALRKAERLAKAAATSNDAAASSVAAESEDPSPAPCPETEQLELGGDLNGELTITTPRPIDDEREPSMS